MKKRIIFVGLIIGMISSITACHKHEFSEATCTAPKTCITCGNTEGEALGHEFGEATCITPKTCSVCGETEGAPLGHAWMDATYDSPMTCSVCGEMQGEPLITEVEEIYNLTLSLKKEDCKQNGVGMYSYNGITFLTEDCEWMDNSLNKDGSINARAFYVKLARCLTAFEIGNAWTDYAPHILGYTPDTREKFAEKVDDLVTYIVETQAADAIINRFKELTSVEIEIDNGCVMTIPDVTKCVEELGISEEMMGYIMGALHDCAAEIDFSGTKCVISYSYYKEQKDVEPLSREDYVVEFPNDGYSKDIYEELLSFKEEYYDAYQWVCYLPGVDSSKEGVLTTARNIRLGDAVDEVIAAYGENSLRFVTDWDEVDTYRAIKEDYSDHLSVFKEQCSSILTYYAKNIGRIEFYFDVEDKLSWVVFWVVFD